MALKDYLAQKLIYENHPSMAAEKCLNTIQTRQQCSVCRDVCPHGVFDDGEPNWLLCDDCGACVARCPARCLRPSALLSGNILELCVRLTGDVVFTCSEHSEGGDLSLGCLAALPWELIALFALEGKVFLLMEHCEDCPRKKLLCHLEDTLDEVRSFLGEDRFRDSVLKCKSDEIPTTVKHRSFTRRDAFGLLFSKSKSTAASLLPEDKDLAPDGMLFRRLLAHRLRQKSSGTQHLNWKIPLFQDSCSACGLCTKVCPDQAIHRIDDDAHSDPHTWYMALIPWRCTGCGICTQSCPSQSLSLPDWTPRTDPTSPIVLPVSALPCSRCGEPLPAGQKNGLCSRCQSETAAPLVW